MQQLLAYDSKEKGLDPKYPPPPGVHWLVLLGAWIAMDAIIKVFSPPRYVGLLESLVVDAWAFYLCTWIRSLDSDAKSPFWCDIYVVVELACAGFGSLQHPSAFLSLAVGVLGIAAAILAIATVFLVRSDLERHYNDREDTGLVLGGFMTFFFSFLYFQYHLYDIARRKKAQADSIGAGAFGSQIP